MQFNVLVLDDEKLVCNSIKRILDNKNRNIFLATKFEEALEIFKSQTIDMMLLDYKLSEIDGITVLQEIKEKYPDCIVIMITGYGNVDIAVKAMKMGAYDFILKNQEPEFIRFTVQRTLDNLRLKKEVEELRETYRKEMQIPEIVSVSPLMKRVKKVAQEYAKTDSTILITGETGTGKSVLAQFIHNHSQRFNQPIIKINCSAIPYELLESELFGYEKGAFTGAQQKGKMGLIERANNGTLFLDEIGELPLDLQSKLLHLFEKGEYYRVGAVEPTVVDIRIITATNRNLQKLVELKEFRLDLFYRLNVASIHIPSLKDRKEDIIQLAKHFVNDLNIKLNKSVTKITKEVENFLCSLPWKGNIRELRNYIERAMLLKKDSELQLQDFLQTSIQNNTIASPQNDKTFSIHINPQPNVNLLHEAQKQLILHSLEITDQNRSKAAKLLGLPRTSLNFYIDKYQIKKVNLRKI